MAALSPTFAVPSVSATPAARVTPSSPASALAPSVTLPLRFVLTGVVSLLAGMALLVARPDLLATYHYNQYTVAATHLFVLGFLCSIVMGAMYQLVPVALETRLHSERMAKWQFAFHLVGFVGMVGMFWVWNLKQVGHFGSTFAVGVGLFVYNIARTLRRVPRWNVVASGIASALVWLSLGVLAGLAVAAGKCTYESANSLAPTNPMWALVKSLQGTARWINRFDALSVMHAHAHLGAVGFFVMMIVSVSYKLLPMFTLSELQNARRASLAVMLLNLGLAGLFVTMALHSAWKLAFALVIVAGLATYAAEMIAVLKARKRRVIDWGIRHFLTALGVLGVLALLGLVLCWPGLPATLFTTQLETVYGFLGIVGVVTFTVLGFLYKIVPFLVWYHTYSREVGRHQVPSLAGLYSERLQVLSYWLFLGGLGLACAGAARSQETLARGGAAVLLTALAVFAVNLGKMLRHFFRPQLVPLIAPQASQSPQP